MPIEIHADSHLDHALTPAHLEFIVREFSDRGGFFIATVTMPEELESLPCGLYGPIMGDPPIAESDVTYRVRGARKCASRMVTKPVRPTRSLTVVAGPHDGKACVLFTAYGGGAAPREPGDPALSTWEALVEARAFWGEHALSENV